MGAGVLQSLLSGLMLLVLTMPSLSAVAGNATPACANLYHSDPVGAQLPVQFTVEIRPPQTVPVTIWFDRQDSYRISKAGADADRPANSFTIEPGQKLPLLASLSPSASDPGLFVFHAYTTNLVTTSDCRQIDVAWLANTGLDRVAHLRLDDPFISCEFGCGSAIGRSRATEALSADKPHHFSLTLVRNDGQALTVPLSVVVVARPQAATLHSKDNDANIPNSPATGKLSGTSPTTSFTLTPQWGFWMDGTSNISVDIKLESLDSPTILQAELGYRTIWPIGWLFTLCLLGALSYALAELVVSARGDPHLIWQRLRTTRGAPFVLAAVAAFVGWIMKTNGALDLKVRTNDELGYLVLGFLLAMLGIEAILKKLSPKPGNGAGGSGAGASTANPNGKNPNAGGAGVADRQKSKGQREQS